ncbi:hypothetical protein ACFQHW_11745 [Lapidilactobacillus achengensis]|uniref:Uncharacterized protein n=1 Tax=Lapidilactobacillus achengensis TaxID=2486000 RepID=A0ABW1UQL4_9LACO|nr:hypothetical protein [Lapidilactobacillus achengensis]
MEEAPEMQTRQNTIAEGALNLLANTGCILPYFFCLVAYQQNRDWRLALPFLVLYAFRAVGILLTAWIELAAAPMLVVANYCGLLGALCLLWPENLLLSTLGGALLGLAASWLWPYFLALKTTLGTGPKSFLTTEHWLWGGVLLIILMIVEQLSTWEVTFRGAFLVLAGLYGLALLGVRSLGRRFPEFAGSTNQLERTLPSQYEISDGPTGATVQQEAAPAPRRRLGWPEKLGLLALLLICYGLRLTRLIKLTPAVTEGIGLFCLLLGLVVLGLQLYWGRRWFPWSILLLNRGIMMNLLLLYAVFASEQRFQRPTLLPIYCLYLVGMLCGPGLLRSRQFWRYPMLVVGLVATLWSATFFFGILACALFLGSENQWLNQQLPVAFPRQSLRIFLVKYQLSALGSLLQQCWTMAVLCLASVQFGWTNLRFMTLITTRRLALPTEQQECLLELVLFTAVLSAGWAWWAERRVTQGETHHRIKSV